MLYVAVDIGCIECGENSAVLGVFDTEDAANAVCEEHKARQQNNWHGQHHFDVFTVDAMNSAITVKY